MLEVNLHDVTYNFLHICDFSCVELRNQTSSCWLPIKVAQISVTAMVYFALSETHFYHSRQHHTISNRIRAIEPLGDSTRFVSVT